MTILTITRTRTERVRVDAAELADMLGLEAEDMIRFTEDGSLAGYIEEYNNDDDGDQMFNGARVSDDGVTVSVAS